MDNIPWVGIYFLLGGIILQLAFYAASRYHYVKNPYASPNYWPCAFAGANALILFGVALIASRYLSGWSVLAVWVAFLIVIGLLAVHAMKVFRDPAPAAGKYRDEY